MVTQEDLSSEFISEVSECKQLQTLRQTDSWVSNVAQ